MSKLNTRVFALGALVATAAHAENNLNTSYRAGSITLPGAEESAHDSGTLEVNQGQASYALPLRLPPGKEGLSPNLAITYGGGRRDGIAGVGWQLGVPSIRVKTSGTGGQPEYGLAVTWHGFDGEDLLPAGSVPDVDADGIDEAVFRAERDQTYLRYVQLSGGGWRVDHPDGRKSWLGQAAHNRIVRATDPDQVAEWLLERIEDPTGHQIVYTWADAATIDASFVSPTARYLTQIRYGCRACGTATNWQQIDLTYAARAPLGLAPVVDHRPGFRIETEAVLTQIETSSTVDGTALTYTLGHVAANGRARLDTVDVSGGNASLPTLRFTYTDSAPQILPDSLSQGPSMAFGNGVQPMDLDKDGRIDVVDLSSLVNPRWSRNLGAQAFAGQAAIAHPPGAAPTANDVSVEDQNRDLGMDVFDLGAGLLFAHDAVDGWAANGIPTTLPPIAFSDDTLRADIDQDGHVDLIDTSAGWSGGHWTIYFNDGAGDFTLDVVDCLDGTANTPTPKMGNVLNASDAGVLTGDVNGDGLLDVLYVVGAQAHLFAGRGRGCFGRFAEDGHGGSVFETFTLVGTSNPVPGHLRLADMNGDGLADIVEINDVANRVNIFLQDPTGQFVEAGPWPQTITAQSGCRIADFDQDAVSEVLCSDQWQIFDLANGQQGLLETIDNGRGLLQTLRYTTTAERARVHAAAGTPWDTNIAAAVPILDSMRTDNGAGSVLETRYDYRDAFYMADELEDRFEFVGFGFVSVEETPYVRHAGADVLDAQDAGALTRTWFDIGDTDWALRGQTLCTEVWPGDASPSGYVCGGAAGALTRAVHTVSSSFDPLYGFSTVQTDAIDTHALEGQASGPLLRREMRYDDFGNVTLEVDWGRFDAADPTFGDDERAVATDWVIDEADWFLRLPKRVRKGAVDTSGIDPDVDPLEETRTAYDGSADWAANDVSQGLPTTLSLRHVDPIQNINAIITVESRQYNADGLIEVRTNAEGIQTHYEYESNLGLLVDREIVDPTGLALVTEYTWDLRHGGQLSVLPPDGQSTRTRYDGLGRVTKLVRPGHTLANPSMRRTYVDAAPISTVRDVRRDGTADGLTETTLLDGRGKMLCRYQDGPVANRVDVLAQSLWSGRGLQTLNARPYRRIGGCEIPASHADGTVSLSRPFTAVEVDASGREVSRRNPDDSLRTISYVDLTITTHDAADNDPVSPHFNTPAVRGFDGLGRLIRETQTHLYRASDQGVHSTQFEYDALDNLIAVRDADDELVYEAIFDSRSRVVWSDDVSLGERTLRYDDLNHLTELTDARNETIVRTFDAAERIETDTRSGGTITYHYDIAHTPAQTSLCNTTGRLAWIEDPSGQEVLCYDPRGNLIGSDKTIDLYSATPLNVRWFYDDQDRVKRMVHPDGTELRRTYDRAGRIDGLIIESGAASQTIADPIEYNAAGQVNRMEYGNGLTVLKYWNERGWLHRAVAGVNGGQTVYQDLTHGYDPVGNITAVTDAVGTRSATFDYDDLYRLVEASGDRYGGGTATYAFDRHGNLTSKTFSDTTNAVHVGALTYAHPTKKHAVSAAFGETFTYDAAGLLTSDDRFVYTYTASGMLEGVTDGAGGVVLDAVYDHADRRIAKTNAAGEQVFNVYGADAQLRIDATGAATWVKRVRLGHESIARIEDTFTANDVSDHVYYQVNDHLGSPRIVFDQAGAVLERLEDHPWGEDNALPAEVAALYRAPGDPDTLLNHRFQDREIDPETGFYDFGARVYRPDLGRFLTPDTIIPDPNQGQSWNRYTFAANNPLLNIDPDGHTQLLIWFFVPDAGVPWEGMYTPDQLPASIPETGTVDWYDRAYDDFVRRFPDQNPPDYYKEYGGKYCKRFTEETYEQLSPAGKEWALATRKALQDKLQALRVEDPHRYAWLEQHPDEFREFAFGTHPDAYLEGGLAHLTVTDWAIIGSTPDGSDLWTGSGAKQVLETGARAGVEMIVDDATPHDPDVVHPDRRFETIEDVQSASE